MRCSDPTFCIKFECCRECVSNSRGGSTDGGPLVELAANYVTGPALCSALAPEYPGLIPFGGSPIFYVGGLYAIINACFPWERLSIAKFTFCYKLPSDMCSLPFECCMRTFSDMWRRAFSSVRHCFCSIIRSSSLVVEFWMGGWLLAVQSCCWRETMRSSFFLSISRRELFSSLIRSKC